MTVGAPSFSITQSIVSPNLILYGKINHTRSRRISGGQLGADGHIEEAVERDKRKQKLERDIAALEKKLLREKQFNRQDCI